MRALFVTLGIALGCLLAVWWQDVPDRFPELEAREFVPRCN